MGAVQPDSVRAELERMLASALFRGRTGKFLRFVVEETLAGRSLKEYVVGTEVFGRPQSFDPRVDAVVRVEAVKLRAKLREWASSAGRDSAVAIDVPKGSYTAVFSERKRSLRAVAVLPFLSLSPDPGDEYLADGLAEELTDALAQNPDLRVVSRTSAFALKGRAGDVREIGNRLGVDAVVEGSVRKAGDKLRITAQVVDTNTGFHLWSGSFDRELRDVLAIQREIAEEVVRRIGGHPARRKPERLSPGFDLYLRGRHAMNQWEPASHGRALDLFAQAAQLDPAYALPHASIARVLVLQSIYGSGRRPREVMPQARAAAEKALSLDPSVADAHAALGVVAARYDFDPAAAEQHFRRALAANPSAAEVRHLYAHDVLMAQCRVEEALEMTAIACENDPLSSFLRVGWRWLLIYAGQVEEAIRDLREWVTPQDLPGQMALGWALVHAGRFEESLPHLEAVARMVPGADGATQLGYAYARAGRPQEARRVLAGLKGDYVRPTAGAFIHLGLGELGEALDFLEAMWEERESALIFLKIDPIFDPLRDHPRFRALLAKTRL